MPVGTDRRGVWDATPALFCGDTLFVGGCGRFFEGTAAQMHANLTARLAALPDHTLAFCAHAHRPAAPPFGTQTAGQGRSGCSVNLNADRLTSNE